MRILTFNVNGIRSLRDDYRKTHGWGFKELLDSLDADIICIQETKANKPDMIDHDIGFPTGYHAYFAFPRIPKKIGYSGVVTYVKDGISHPAISYHDTLLSGSPLQGWPSADLELLDSEGRIMVTDHDSFLLCNVYFPNYGGPERAEFRNRFYTAFMERCDELIKAGKSIVIATDFNTVYHPLDHCDFVKPYMEEIVEKSGFDGANKLLESTANWLVELVKRMCDDREDGLPSMQNVDDLLATNPIPCPTLPPLLQTFFREKGSRPWAFIRLQGQRFVDSFRLYHADEPDRFTCWNTLIGARGGNYGTRLDYIFVGGPMFEQPKEVITDSDQMYKFMGSDHCPVWTDFKFPPVEMERSNAPALATNIRKQQRLDSFFKSKTTTQTGKSKTTNPAVAIKVIEKTRSTKVINTVFGVKRHESVELQLCDQHQEVCKEWSVKKAGPNKGKKFYLCSRPVGHPTDKEARCNFFKWKS